MKNQKVNIRALVSGVFAAGASCCAKVGLDPESTVARWATDQCLAFQSGTLTSKEYVCDGIGMASRGLFLLGMVSMNLLMVATFFEGMIESGSTIATALATGSNFTVSVSSLIGKVVFINIFVILNQNLIIHCSTFQAIVGVMLFNENVNQTWVLGFALILCGVWLLSSISVKKNIA